MSEIKKKRGRKSKKELELLKKQQTNGSIENKLVKKRGRKPKGGKIIKNIQNINDELINQKENVILHLKCSSSFDNSNFLNELTYNPNIEDIKAYDKNEVEPLKNDYFNIEVSYTKQNNENKYNNNHSNFKYENIENIENNENQMKDIWNKIRELQHNFSINNIKNNSNCFWCTCSFDNPPIFIPKFKINKVYEVYGCFCSPECASGFLFNENIDNAIKWERYSLLNTIYGKIYNYEKNINPAPNPYYTLDKYYGNLSINEYRKLFTSNSVLIIVDKPLTRVLPEIQDDNNDYFSNETKNKNNYNLSRNKPLYNYSQSKRTY